jgi:hypothetical protein
MTKGLLKCGDSLTSSVLYFIHIDNNSYLTMYLIDIKFLGKMKNMIYIKGGTICIEGSKIINENWVEPLIEVEAITSGVIINFFSNNINNCNYTCIKSIPYKSGIIFISDVSTENLMLNISYCIFYENTFNLFYNDSGFGNICCFYSKSITSSMLIIFCLIFMFMFISYFLY